MVIIFFSPVKLLFEGASILYQLSYISDGLIYMNLKNITGTKSKREYLPDLFLRILRTNILVYAFDYEGVQLDELVHYLLVWLEFKLDHF